MSPGLTSARWPGSRHIEPVPVPAGDPRVLLSGIPPRLPVRVLSEDEYQLLLAGFLAAGGQMVQPGHRLDLGGATINLVQRPDGSIGIEP